MMVKSFCETKVFYLRNCEIVNLGSTLIAACTQENVNVVKYLVSKGVNVSKRKVGCKVQVEWKLRIRCHGGIKAM